MRIEVWQRNQKNPDEMCLPANVCPQSPYKATSSPSPYEKPARKITKINKPMPKIRSAHSKATQHTGLGMALR